MTCILKHCCITVADRMNKEQRIYHKLLIQNVYSLQSRTTLTNMMFECDLVTCISMSCALKCKYSFSCIPIFLAKNY